MKSMFLGGVAVLGLALLPQNASAAAIGAGARDLLEQPSLPMLIQVQQHPHHGGGGGHHGGDGGHHGGGGDGAGAAAAGAAIGIFLGAMMAAEAQRQQAVQYCMRRFRSYDPNSMTYVGRDGRRHRCP
jgi:hypothetical protein